jgi:xylulose-5-phosphate/fructose-6-phosphate phosphoketolase
LPSPVLRSFLFITGPGHGAPSALACLYLEGAITKFYPQYAGDRAGLKALIRAFSFPGGFPSHVNAETPGAIHEGGELGYALAVAYGSVRASSFALIRISPNRLAAV